MSAETDVLQAAGAQWDTFFMGVPFPGGLYLNQLPIAGVLSSSSLPALPYAIMSAKRDRKPKWAQRSFTEYTRLTFELYGVDVLGPVLSQLANIFKWPQNKLNFSFTLLQTPSTTVGHMYTELGDRDEHVETLERNGRKLRKAILTYVIWTQRLDI